MTNVGTFGNVMGTPIINQPQVAIMAAGAIRKKPAVLRQNMVMDCYQTHDVLITFI